MEDGVALMPAPGTAAHGGYQDLDGRRAGLWERFSSLFRSHKQRNGVVASAVLGVLTVVVVVAVVVGLRARDGDGGHVSGSRVFDTSTYTTGVLNPRGVAYQWLAASENGYTQIASDGTIVKLAFADPAAPVETVLVGDAGLVANASSYSVSSDGAYVLLATETEQLYRHSSTSVFVLYDVAGGTHAPLTTGRCRTATFAPVVDAGTHRVVFVRDNNVFVRTLETAEETAVTTDGTRTIQNGVPTWVFEEEIFASDSALWVSPDGERIAFLQFNETHVPDYTFPVYGDEYPEEYTYHYPLAGYPISTVSLAVHDVSGGTTSWAALPSGQDAFITRVSWVNSSHVVARVSNRLQNELTTYLIDGSTAASRVVNVWTATHHWIEPHDSMVFVPGQPLFLDLRANGNHRHIGLYSLEAGVTPGNAPVRWLTAGAWDVVSVLGLADAGASAVFVSAEGVTTRHVAHVAIAGGDPEPLSRTDGWYTADLAPDGLHMVVYDGGALADGVVTVPTYTLTSVVNPDHVLLAMQDNAGLATELESFRLPHKSFVTLEGATGTQLEAYVIEPLDFDPSGSYPVFFYWYGGPGSQQVQQRYGADWRLALAGEGFYVVCVDNTGTGFRGLDFEQATYQRLGELEAADQIAAAQHFLQTHPAADATRTAGMGWSYGGFMATTLASKGHTVYRALIAVAPVTSWRLYDNLYTERYMQTPATNAQGYDATDVNLHAAGFAQPDDVALLIIHGTGDDNVHISNTHLLTAALVKQQVQFDMITYTNQNHGISADGSHQHIYQHMDAFLKRILALPPH